MGDVLDIKAKNRVGEFITLPVPRTSPLPSPPNKYFLLVNSSIILFYDVWWLACVVSRDRRVVLHVKHSELKWVRHGFSWQLILFIFL